MALYGAVQGLRTAVQLVKKLRGVLPRRQGKEMSAENVQEASRVLMAAFDELQEEHRENCNARHLLLQRCYWLKLHLHISRSRYSKLALVGLKLQKCKRQLQLSRCQLAAMAAEQDRSQTALQAALQAQAQQLAAGAAALAELQQQLEAERQSKLQQQAIVAELQGSLIQQQQQQQEAELV